jgi:hypothetical protein
MKAVHTLETSVSVYRRKQHHVREERNRKLHCRDNLKTRFVRAVIIKFNKSDCMFYQLVNLQVMLNTFI